MVNALPPSEPSGQPRPPQDPLPDADAHRDRYPATLVCGTVFMMTEARKFLGLEYPVDPDGVLHMAPVAPLAHAAGAGASA